jgi:hypothetical protein
LLESALSRAQRRALGGGVGTGWGSKAPPARRPSPLRGVRRPQGSKAPPARRPSPLRGVRRPLERFRLRVNEGPAGSVRRVLRATATRVLERSVTRGSAWATGATEAHTHHEGRCVVFAVIGHATGEAWVDAAPWMDRRAAADLLREVTTERFGSVDAAVAAGLALRYDGGPCFRSDHYQAEIDHLGIAPDRPPTTTSPRPTAASRSSSRPSRSRCCGSSASTASRSCAHASAASPPTTTSTARTPPLPHPAPGTPDAPSGRDDMITAFTNQVSGEPGAAHAHIAVSQHPPPAPHFRSAVERLRLRVRPLAARWPRQR